MNDVIKFLNENPLIYLATEGLDGNAKVRPILYYFEENNKPYFCTRRWDAKFNEFLFLEKFMFVSYFLVIFHDYFIIDSF